MTKIKVCGNTRPTDVRLAVDLGVDLLGFIFTRSKRQIDVRQARVLLEDVPETIERVGVFNDEPPEEVAAIARACQLSAVQLYRPIRTEDRAMGLLLLSAFRVRAGEDLNELRVENGDRLLLDAWAADRVGGTGRTWPWAMAKDVARRQAIVVSGGLTAGNVSHAVNELCPWAVDVCSGVEAEPGRKDPAKLQAFVAAVRQADQAAPPRTGNP